LNVLTRLPQASSVSITFAASAVRGAVLNVIIILSVVRHIKNRDES